jgi:hypothetical protein
MPPAAASMTMEAWVRPSAAASGYRTVVMKERPGGHAWTLYSTYAAPRAEVYVAGYRGASGTAPLAAGTWTHLAATVSDGSLRLYVNGTLVKTTALPGPLTSTDSPLRIGGNSFWAKEFFAGLIDEVRIYNRALSATQIQADMNTAIAPDQAPPTAPGNLTANGSLGQVALDWNAASDDLRVGLFSSRRSR